MAREMKDSGIEWIGEIPSEWKVAMLKRIASIQTGSTPAKSEENIYYSTEKGIPWIKAENLGTNLSIKETTEYLTDDGAKVGRVFEPNTVYVCCIASVGKVGYSDLTASCNQQINALCFKNFNWKYGYYMSCSQEMEYLLNASGNVMKIINSDKQSSIMCPVPPLPEQQKIAAHLDSECAKIDDVITKTKATIEEYKKLKQSVITEAVTKGIRPNREMKDSGIEWIGEIPREWETSLIKYHLKWKSEKGFPNEQVLSLYRDYGVIPKDSRDDNHNVTSLDTSGYKLVNIGDFVINKMKAWQGSMAVSEYRGIISPAYHICEFYSNSFIKRYFHYLLRNNSYLPEYERLSTGMRTGQWDLGFDDFKNIPIIVPNLTEQQEIADYLDKKCSEIDTLIAKKEQIVTELESYKKSIIYEYVTGKKEVI